MANFSDLRERLPELRMPAVLNGTPTPLCRDELVFPEKAQFGVRFVRHDDCWPECPNTTSSWAWSCAFRMKRMSGIRALLDSHPGVDVVHLNLAQDSSFYDRYLADGWTGGTSRGTWDTKRSLVADMNDTKNNKTKSESIRDVKVRDYGDTAIASYTSTYDSMIKGQHYARTIISTDTFVRQNGEWKQVAGHSSQAAK